MILAAYFNCTPINYGDNITIIISAYGINTVNVTVLSNATTKNVTKNDVLLSNGIGVINIGVSEYNTTLLPGISGEYSRQCNESNGCYIYFNVSYLNGSAVVWRLSDNNLTIWASGATPQCIGVGEAGPTQPPVQLPTPHIITPTKLCSESGQLSACCNTTTTDPRSYYYNASASIWHNATVENWQTGWNWSWLGLSDYVKNVLDITDNDTSKINLTHIYDLNITKNVNATNVWIVFTTFNKSYDLYDFKLVPLSNCIQYQPIVIIEHPKNGSKHTHGKIWHNATIIDPDNDDKDFNFSWWIWLLPWNSDELIPYNFTIFSGKDPNKSFTFNLTGNYTSTLIVSDKSNYWGMDFVSFEVINESCNCSNPITPCGAWNPSKSSGGTFCNLSKQWEDYCLINENCPSGYICNASKQCQGRPSDCPVPGTSDFNKGCSFYQNQIECETDKCSLGRTDVDKLDSSYIVYYGCSWNGTSCVQNFTTLNPITGSMENCYYSTNIPPCPESGGEITITRTTICCKDGSCTPTSTTESYTCPQPISFALPGWSWLNVVLVVMLLAVFYLALWKWGRRKEKTKN
jgi:hypothetical protein